jgi:hypothetical protein
MRKFLLALTTIVAVVAPTLAVAAPANATNRTPGCVTRAEYRLVTRGMSPDRVATIFGTRGTLSYSYLGTYVFSMDREYRPCYPYTTYSHVEVDFTKSSRYAAWRVKGKSSWWISSL